MSSRVAMQGVEAQPVHLGDAAARFVDAGILENARTLEGVIREHSDQAERDRRLPRPVIDALAQMGLQRMLLPKSLGGLEVSPVTCARVIEEIAGFDSAAGWALQPGNSGAWWSARLPEEGVEEIYGADPNALMAASFHPPQRAVEEAGGYRLSGRGAFASNIHDSAWVLATAFVMDGEQPRMTANGPLVVALVMRTNEVEIVDTWDTIGMRGTDSNDFLIEDVFVPASRAYVLAPAFTPGQHYQGPLYRFPAVSAVTIIGAPPMLAIARGAIDEVLALAGGKTPMGSMKTLRDRAVAQATIGEAEAILRSARAYFYETLAAAWARTLNGEGSNLEQKAELLMAGVHAVKCASRVADMMHRLAGSTGIYERNRLARHFRDAQTLRHHGFVSENKFQSVGQVYLGVNPEFDMVHF